MLYEVRSIHLEGTAPILGILQGKFDIFILGLGVRRGTPRHMFRTLLLFGLLVQSKKSLSQPEKLT